MIYRSKTISLDEETWAAFERVRKDHGSYNKALRHVFTAGGVFEPEGALKGPEGVYVKDVSVERNSSAKPGKGKQ